MNQYTKLRANEANFLLPIITPSLTPASISLALASIFLTLMGSDEAAAAPAKWAPGHILVQPRAGYSAAAFDDVLNGHGAKSVKKINGLDVHVVQVPAGTEDHVAQQLSRNPHIKFAEKDMMVEMQFVPNDQYFGMQWHATKIQAPSAWDSSTAQDVMIAVLDTGVEGTHPDLVNNLVPGWNVVSNSSDTSDINGHGTAVAGTVAATTNNTNGVSSVAWKARLMPMRITNDTAGWAYWSDVANAVTWAADHGAKVASISYGVSNSSTVTSAAQYLRNKGGLVVAAAMNDGVDPGYSDNPYIISVSATDQNDAKASWSNYGAFIDVAAPGVDIVSTMKGTSYGIFSGTSFSTPITAGVVGLIMAANPNLTPTDVENVLEKSADDPVAGVDFHAYFGNGRVNAYKAVQLALQSSPSDWEAPVASIFSPGNGTQVSGNVAVEVSAVDNIGITQVELYAGSQKVGVDAVAPYQFSWNSTSVADGNVALYAMAYDAAGNVGTSSNVTVAVVNTADTTAPTVIFNSPANAASISGVNSITVSVNATDNIGVASIVLYIDNVKKTSVTSGSLSYIWSLRKVTAGKHTLTAVSKDKSGNTSSSVIYVYR